MSATSENLAVLAESLRRQIADEQRDGRDTTALEERLSDTLRRLQLAADMLTERRVLKG